MELHRYDLRFPLAALREDARRVLSAWDWNRGAHGHALSLPRARDLHPSARHRYENQPCTGLLDGCPAFRAVFDSFPGPKVSFRLMRRPAGTAYEWHTDRWKGPGVARFQIPIHADDRAFLVLTDYEDPAEPSLPRPLHANGVDALVRAQPARVRAHRLEAGFLYHFDTSRVHTMINGSDAERVVLSMDLVADEWLLERFPEVTGEVGSAPEAPSSPGVAARTAAWALARLHPARRLARRLGGMHP